MIKLLEDLLIEASTNPNVPGSLVAGLRKAVDTARGAAVPELDPGASAARALVESVKRRGISGTTRDIDGYRVDVTKHSSPPQVATDPPYRVCVKAHETNVGNTVPVGRVVTLEAGELLQQPACWLPCDKDGWVASSHIGPMGLKIEWRDGAGTSDWRPLPPKPSAIDEMAEQMKRWAAPTREDACQLASRQSLAQDTELPARESVVPSIEIYQAIAWFDKDGKIQGRVSVELLDALCEQALADLEERNGWEASRQAQEDAHFESLKPTNPKDAAATDRVPLGLLSPIAKAHWALAQHCGRAKYGAWNWREAGVRASIYIDAIGRHIDGYLSGETYDPADGTHHLGNIMACCAILLEAEAAGKLTDDRPPTLDMRPTYDEVRRRLADLTTKYADRNPKHWTR